MYEGQRRHLVQARPEQITKGVGLDVEAHEGVLEIAVSTASRPDVWCDFEQFREHNCWCHRFDKVFIGYLCD